MSEYERYTQGSSVPVWYSSDDPYINDTAANVQSSVSGNNLVGNLIAAGKYTLPVFLILNFVLASIFGRESKKEMPEGFYTESSWLDVDDNYMVGLKDDELVYFDIDKNKVSKVQALYQKDESLDEILGAAKSSKLQRIPLSEITHINSVDKSDVFKVTQNTGDKSHDHTVEFLNLTLKKHALERLTAKLPNKMLHKREAPTRLASIAPSVFVLCIISGAALFMNNFLIYGLLGLLALIWPVRKILSNLVSPPVYDRWTMIESIEDMKEPELKQAA